MNRIARFCEYHRLTPPKNYSGQLKSSSLTATRLALTGATERSSVAVTHCAWSSIRFP